MEWFYAREGTQLGPVHQAAFDDLIRTGAITPDTLVWNAGLPNWEAWGNLANAPDDEVNGTIETVCCECGARLSLSETVYFQKNSICSACKDAYFLRLFQGTERAQEWVTASMLKRLFAAILDQMLLACVNFMFSLVYLFVSVNDDSLAMGMYYIVSTLAGMAVALLYEIWFIWRYGATPGKMVFRIKVIVSDGTPVSFMRSTGRYFAKVLSGMIFMIGYIMAFFDDERRTLHDRMCDTRVVQEG